MGWEQEDAYQQAEVRRLSQPLHVRRGARLNYQRDHTMRCHWVGGRIRRCPFR